MPYRTYQSYCDRLRQDRYFLTSNGRLSEHLADKVILQLNRVYPQILTNKEAEKFRNPKALLHIRLSELISHLQKKGDKHCQEFYRALQINAEQLYNDLPSRKTLMVMPQLEHCVQLSSSGHQAFGKMWTTRDCREVPCSSLLALVLLQASHFSCTAVTQIQKL
ncbi:caspase recruitment domain-containing protein 19 isoform X4 [Carettochelys insculpta]|uniref:caspase recruitment domain-containing protein 19 isoform X4 n=1 Tax=Carettochelys insculpta TaxID=44489 RepID=UPI003EB90459